MSASGSGTLSVSCKGCHFFPLNDYGFGTETKRSWIVLQVEHVLEINPWSACTQNNGITFNTLNRITYVFIKYPGWFWCTECLKTFGIHVGWQVVLVCLGLRDFSGCRTLSAKAGTVLGKQIVGHPRYMWVYSFRKIFFFKFKMFSTGLGILDFFISICSICVFIRGQ